MRALQFWILIFASTVVGASMIKQIFLTRELNKQHRTLVEYQQVISEGTAYQNAWQKLAMSIYQASREDPTLAEVLRKESVEVRATHNTDNGAATPPAAPGQEAPAKSPGALPHSATP
jgi:hypothetical protein